LKNNPDATEPVLNDNAVHILNNSCDSGVPKTPNNTYGNGRVDILAAVGAVEMDTVTITRAQFLVQRSQLTVLATDSNPAAVLTVSVTGTGEVLGTMTNLGNGNYTFKKTGIANPRNITVTSNLGGTATARVRAR